MKNYSEKDCIKKEREREAAVARLDGMILISIQENSIKTTPGGVIKMWVPRHKGPGFLSHKFYVGGPCKFITLWFHKSYSTFFFLSSH